MTRTKKPKPLKEDLLWVLKESLTVLKGLTDIIIQRLEEWERDKDKDERSKRQVLQSLKEKVREEGEKCSRQGDEAMAKAFFALEGFIEKELSSSRAPTGKKARKVKIK